MQLDTAKRKAEEDRMIFQQKNRALRAEVEELVKENKKLTGSIDGLNERLHSLRKVNKQQERRLESSNINMTTLTGATGNNTTIKQPKQAYLEAEKKRKKAEEWAAELEDKLAFTVEKFEE